ncbi:MAG: hypothetical protein C0506_06635 [Anaerolinea sp.]|nr:hypothetical protein [Anaerolinea sp.]
MNAKLGVGTIIMAIAIGTAVGPLSTLGDVTTANLTDSAYWLDLLAAAIRSFSSVAVAGLGLLAGAFGVPMLRGKPIRQPEE